MRYAVLDLPSATEEQRKQKRELVLARMVAINGEQKTLEETDKKCALPESRAKALALSEEFNALDRWSQESQSPVEKPMPGGSGGGDCAVRAITGGIEQRKHAAMFPNRGGNSGFASLDEFMRAVHLGHDPRLAECQKRAMNEGIGSEGGFLVPDEFASQVFDVGLEDEIVRPRATLYPMQSDTLHVPALAIGNHSTNLYGGISAAWTTEGGTLSESEPAFRMVTLNAKKCYAYGYASNEVIADGVSFEQTVMGAFAKSVSWTMDRAFLTGTGAGQPLGILNAPCTVTVSGEGGQAADTIVYQNLTKMLGRLAPESFRRSVWIASPSTIPQLLNLSIVVGTGGSVYPVLTESNGEFKILTRPVVFTERASTLGDLGDIMLADFSQYAIGQRAAVVVQKSGHARFGTDETVYRCITRVDGSPLWDSALTPADGSANTLSPFVILQAR